MSAILRVLAVCAISRITAKILSVMLWGRPFESSCPRTSESFDISINLMASLTSSFSTTSTIRRRAKAVANLKF